jgi:hypothetical protein
MPILTSVSMKLLGKLSIEEMKYGDRVVGK